MGFQMMAMQQLSGFGLMCLLLLSTYTVLIKLTLMGLVLWYMLMFFNTLGTLYSAGAIHGNHLGILPESRGVLFFSDLFTKMSMYQYPMFVAAVYEIYHYQNTGDKNYYILNINITDGQTSSPAPLKSQSKESQRPNTHTAASASEKFFHSLQGPVILHSFWCEVATMVVSDLVNGGVIEERLALYLFTLDHLIHYASATVHLLMSLRHFLPLLFPFLNEVTSANPYKNNNSENSSGSIFSLSFEDIYSYFLFYIPQAPSTFTCVCGLFAALAMIYSVHVNPVLLQEFGGPTASLRKYLFGMRIAQIFQAVTLVSLIS